MGCRTSTRELLKLDATVPSRYCTGICTVTTPPLRFAFSGLAFEIVSSQHRLSQSRLHPVSPTDSALTGCFVSMSVTTPMFSRRSTSSAKPRPWSATLKMIMEPSGRKLTCTGARMACLLDMYITVAKMGCSLHACRILRASQHDLSNDDIETSAQSVFEDEAASSVPEKSSATGESPLLPRLKVAVSTVHVRTRTCYRLPQQSSPSRSRW